MDILVSFEDGSSAFIEHHGILGQKWGVKNGPPYPLGGGDYTALEREKIGRERKLNKYSRYNKKHYDTTLKKGSELKTLTFDPTRTDKTDMFYAATNKIDEHHYKAFFDKKAPTTLYDKKGNAIGTGEAYKFSVTNTAVKDLKVASEDSGVDAFVKLYSSDRDFYNFVNDPKRLRARFEEGVHRGALGYETARKTMDRMQTPGYKPTSKDLEQVYRIFNHSIPAGCDNARYAKDVVTQRAKFFNELKKNGYDAVLDTNDALYNAVQANNPVIVFNMESIVKTNVYRTTGKDVAVSKLINTGRHAVGL